MAEPTPMAAYCAEAVMEDGVLADIRFHLGSKTWHLWGRSGAQRENGLALTLEKELAESNGTALPVLIGSGLGVCLDKVLASTDSPVAVVDREQAVLKLTGARERFADNPRVTWLDGPAEEVMERLARWRDEHGGGPLFPMAIPLYLRLDREHYRAIAQGAAATRNVDFWARAAYPKFASITPRVLLLERSYFLYREIGSALSRLGVEHRSLSIGEGDTAREGFIEELLKTVVDFKPDFLLTVNHLGMDREGRLAGLLQRLGLPMASWFVDNPHLILHRYQGLSTDSCVLFTWDADTVDSLKDLGFSNVHYLPLATDEARFFPGAPQPKGFNPDLECCRGPIDVSFVGSSMAEQTAKRLRQAAAGPELEKAHADVAAGFSQAASGSVPEYLRANHAALFERFEQLPTLEQKLSYEALITWEATRRYRAECVRRLLPFFPLVVGDDGWSSVLPELKRIHPPLDYYDDLPGFYQLFAVNFNCTSKQMKGAVNQRVFDVPACGGFVLTDHRAQLDDLFEPGVESAVFHAPEEIPELTERFLKDADARRAVAGNARKRVLADHTYVRRLSRMLDVMRESFG